MVIDISDLESYLIDHFKSFNVFLVNSYLLYCNVPFSLVKSELKEILEILPSNIDFTISPDFANHFLMITFYVPVSNENS